MRQPGANHAPRASVPQVNLSVQILSTFLRIRADNNNNNNIIIVIIIIIIIINGTGYPRDFHVNYTRFNGFLSKVFYSFQNLGKALQTFSLKRSSQKIFCN